MYTRRYMIVTHSKDNKDAVSVHGLLADYHWHRLDDDHVLLYGSYLPSHGNKLREHPDVSVMPHAVSSKPLSVHLDKTHHLKALSTHMKIEEDAQMTHFLDAVETRLGPVFQPMR